MDGGQARGAQAAEIVDVPQVCFGRECLVLPSGEDGVVGLAGAHGLGHELQGVAAEGLEAVGDVGQVGGHRVASLVSVVACSSM